MTAKRGIEAEHDLPTLQGNPTMKCVLLVDFLHELTTAWIWKVFEPEENDGSTVDAIGYSNPT